MEPFRFLDVPREAAREEVVGVVEAPRVGRHDGTEGVVEEGVDLADGDAEELAHLHELAGRHLVGKPVEAPQHVFFEHGEGQAGTQPRILQPRDARGDAQQR